MSGTAEQPRWLSAAEQQAWIGITAIMWKLPAPLDAQLQRDSKLTLFEYVVLSFLSMADGRRHRMSELAGLTNASPSRLSNVVSKLEQRGWLRREVDPEDRRGAVAELTEAGWDVVVAAAPGHVETVRSLIFDALRPEQIAALQTVGEELRRCLPGRRAASDPVLCAADPEPCSVDTRDD